MFSNTAVSSGSFPLTFSADSSVYAAPACFAAGTRVTTAGGEVAVEDLAVGDEVLTASGITRPVIWIGSRWVRPATYPNPAEVHPIHILAGAFGDGVPARDLRLSPGHAVFMDGILVPVGHLVNGATIIQEAVDKIRYFHVELDAHDVLLAEGLTCESYLEDGNREVFANSPEHLALYGRLDPLDWDGACAPVVKSGPGLVALQARLHARAEALGWTKSAEPELSLTAVGVSIAPLHRAGSRMWFQVPAAGDYRLVSKASRPIELVPGQPDPRRLGLALSEVRADGLSLDLEDPAFGEGFHGLERLEQIAWRWTDGQAVLTLAGPCMLEIAVHMVAPSWARPAVAPRLVAVG
ncbi:MAG: Hint domain-containing protein [Caulobacteraceae bacterium]|nr:Hint domain-containing protein [Caulobacteraceae bacterium]